MWYLPKEQFYLHWIKSNVKIALIQNRFLFYDEDDHGPTSPIIIILLFYWCMSFDARYDYGFVNVCFVYGCLSRLL